MADTLYNLISTEIDRSPRVRVTNRVSADLTNHPDFPGLRLVGEIAVQYASGCEKRMTGKYLGGLVEKQIPDPSMLIEDVRDLLERKLDIGSSSILTPDDFPEVFANTRTNSLYFLKYEKEVAEGISDMVIVTSSPFFSRGHNSAGMKTLFGL